MIVVTGANGQLGKLVIKDLLARSPGQKIVAMVRSPEKASDLASLGVEIRMGDYDRPETLEPAMRGAKKVLLISSSAIGHRLPQHRAAIEAATRAGVGALVYTSLLHADRSPLNLAEEHFATETLIRDSGIPYIFLRNGWYVENYGGFIPSALEHGALIGCAGNGRISWAARADYAAAAAVVLTRESPLNVIHELAGDTGHTLSEFAEELSRQSGKQVRYVNMEKKAYIAALLGAGLPKPLADLLGDSDAGAAGGGLFDEGRELSRLIGRPTASLKASVSALLGK